MEFLAKGNTLLIQEAYTEALAAFDSAIAEQADLYDAHLHRAIALLRLHQPSEAASAASEAIRLGSDNYQGYLRRGQAAFAQQKWTTALPDF